MGDPYPAPRGTAADQLAVISAQLGQILELLQPPAADLTPIRARIKALEELADLGAVGDDVAG